LYLSMHLHCSMVGSRLNPLSGNVVRYNEMLELRYELLRH
jgi:hypothetical protein